MKKTILFSLFILYFVQLRAQNSVILNVKFLQNSNYQTAVNLGVKLTADIKGDQGILNALSAQGITQPVNAVFALGMNGNITTGGIQPDSTFPMDLEYKIANIDISANGKKLPIPAMATQKNIRVVAHVQNDWQIILDSVAGKKVNDSTEKNIQQMIGMYQKRMQFPEKPLKPGDSFTQVAPITLPVKGNSDVKINGSVVYKLISISDGKAFFDLVPTFNMNFVMKKAVINLTGTGFGKMVYSIKDNFPISKDATINMKVKVTSDKINIDGTALITSTSVVTIN